MVEIRSVYVEDTALWNEYYALPVVVPGHGAFPQDFLRIVVSLKNVMQDKIRQIFMLSGFGEFCARLT